MRAVYFLLSIFTWLEIFICLLIFIPFQVVLYIFSAPFDRNRRLLLYNGSLVTYVSLLLSPVWKVTVEGRENLDRSVPCVAVMNHQSMIDILLIYRLFFPVKLIAKKSLALVPVIGWNLFLSGHLLINRSSRKSQFDAIRKMNAAIENGGSLLVFPEGTRTRDGNLGQFKKGAFRTAIATGVPVLPVVIDGAYQSLPRKRFTVDRFQHIKVRVLPLVPVSQDDKPGELADKCRDLMAEELERMRSDG